MDLNRHEFLADIDAHIERLQTDIEELHSHPPTEATAQLIDSVFRHLHSIKGLAATASFDHIKELAHEFESLVATVRVDQSPIGARVLRVFEKAAAAMSESSGAAASDRSPENQQELIAEIRAMCQVPKSIDVPVSIVNSIPATLREILTETEKERLARVFQQGIPLFAVAASFEFANFTDEFSKLKDRLRRFGEVIATTPSVSAQGPDQIDFRLIYASRTNSVDLQSAVADFPVVSFIELPPVSEAPKESETSSAQQISEHSKYIRTDLEKVDSLISSTYDLFRTTSSTIELALAEPTISSPTRAQLENLEQRIKNSFRDIESELVSLRLLPLGPILQRALRAGRAAARLAGKEIDFQLGGVDLRLDKVFADALSGPLIHLVRNAVDHGIESSEERAAAGKNRRGMIKIEGVSEGTQTRLLVVDDGRGIDPESVSAAAKRLGIATGATPLDFERSVRLIFRPGFTTIESVSETSGRGVGLDVVENAVEQLGGELRVSSTIGKGSIFEIRLPLTSGLINATVVISAGHRYCIPTSEIVSILTFANQPVLEDVNVLQLRELLGQQAEDTTHLSRLIIISPGSSSDQNGDDARRVGLVVDEVAESDDFLVRSLGRHSGRWYGIAGATESRDGTIGLVLDLGRLIQ